MANNPKSQGESTAGKKGFQDWKGAPSSWSKSSRLTRFRNDPGSPLLLALVRCLNTRPPSPPAAAESSLRASPCLQGPALHTAAGGNFLEHREVAHLLCLNLHRGRPPGTPGYLLLPVHLASPLLRLLYLLLAAPGCPRHLGRLSLSLKPTFYVCHLLSEAFPTPGHEDRYVRPPRRSRRPSLNVGSPYQGHRRQHEKLTLSLPRSG